MENQRDISNRGRIIDVAKCVTCVHPGVRDDMSGEAEADDKCLPCKPWRRPQTNIQAWRQWLEVALALLANGVMHVLIW